MKKNLENNPLVCMVFENHRKSLIQASYVYILSGQHSLSKMPKMVHLATFWKAEACGPTVLPDMSILVSQKLSEYAKIEAFY